MAVNRRKPEEVKEILNLKESIIERSQKHAVTGYQFYHNGGVGMSIPALDNILKGNTSRPNIETLRAMDQYLRENFEHPAPVVEEAQRIYQTNNSSLDAVMVKLGELVDMVEKSSLKQDIIFEIIKSAKAAELSYMNTEGEKKISSLQG